jgi:hypothetical protein
MYITVPQTRENVDQTGVGFVNYNYYVCVSTPLQCESTVYSLQFIFLDNHVKSQCVEVVKCRLSDSGSEDLLSGDYCRLVDRRYGRV